MEVVKLGLWVIVEEAELLVEAGEADVVDAGPVELAVWLATLPESVVGPAPTPADTRPPPVPPRPSDTPPLPRDTPIRGSPLELVVVKVESDAAEVVRLELGVMVELLPPEVVEASLPMVADTRPPPVPPMPSDTPPLPSDTPIRGSPLELVVVKVTSDADEDKLGLEVMVELLPAAVVEAGVDEGVVEPDPPPTPAEIRPPPVPPRPSDTPPLPSDTPMRGSPLELVVVKVTSDAEVD